MQFTKKISSRMYIERSELLINERHTLRYVY